MLNYYYPFYFTRKLRNLKNYVWWTEVVSPDQIHVNWLQRVFNLYYQERDGNNQFSNQWKLESYKVIGDGEEDAVTQGMAAYIVRVKMVWKRMNSNNDHDDGVVPPNSFIMKSIHQTLEGYKSSSTLNSQREAIFYGRLSKDLLTPTALKTLPEIYHCYAANDGCNYVILMEDLSDDKAASVSKLLGNQCWGNPNLSQQALRSFSKGNALRTIFSSMADLHARSWKKSELLQYPTQELKYASWLRGDNRDDWELGITKVRRGWEKIKQEMPQSTVLWPKNLVKIIDTTLSNSSWEKFRETVTNPDFIYSLVHGDFHGGNMFWNINYSQQVQSGNDDATPFYLVDWSEVGAFCPFSELSQFIISNVDISNRKLYEEELFRIYFERLESNGIQNLNYSQCFNRYKMGGIERWIQFIVIMKPHLNDPSISWFIEQLDSFVEDHIDSIPLQELKLMSSYPLL